MTMIAARHLVSGDRLVTSAGSIEVAFTEPRSSRRETHIYLKFRTRASLVDIPVHSDDDLSSNRGHIAATSARVYPKDYLLDVAYVRPREGRNLRW
jgi:hypothetical protein